MATKITTPTMKDLVRDLQVENQDMPNNEFIAEILKKMGMRGSIGGPAFSEVKYFLKNMPDIDSILRTRRKV